MAQAQKQLYKESRNRTNSMTSPTNHPKQMVVLKDEISAVCNATSDCVAGINLTIDRIGEKMKSEFDAMKNEVDSKYHVFKMLLNERNENTVGALKNEFDSRFDAIHQTSEKQAESQLKIEVAIEVAIKELYKKVQYMEQILFRNDDRNNLELVKATSVTSTPQKDELVTHRKEEAVKSVLPLKPPDNLELPKVNPSTSEKGALDSQKEEAIEEILTSIFKPSDAVSSNSSPNPPQSTTLVQADEFKPKIDNNLVVSDSVQSAGSYSFKVNYEL
jgi:hypothetical protein